MKKINLLMLSLFVIFFSAVPSEKAIGDSGIDCGDVCNDICYTHYMEPCSYTYCDFDGKSGTWMCLGQFMH